MQRTGTCNASSARTTPPLPPTSPPTLSAESFVEQEQRRNFDRDIFCKYTAFAHVRLTRPTPTSIGRGAGGQQHMQLEDATEGEEDACSPTACTRSQGMRRSGGGVVVVWCSNDETGELWCTSIALLR